MKKFILLVSCFTSAILYGQDYMKLHQKSILVDTHNDILTEAFDKHVSFDSDLRGKTQSDLQRMLAAGVDVQVFSIWCDGKQVAPFSYANLQIDTLYSW